MAAQLSRCRITVIVAAVSMCSRPEPLKPFLYLDFMNREKKKAVWDMLLQNISRQMNCNVCFAKCAYRDYLWARGKSGLK